MENKEARPHYDFIVLDNGHGVDTAGKRSPDGTFLEYEFNRDLVARVIRMAEIYSNNHNVDILNCFHVLVPEETDVPLGTNKWTTDCRIKRINNLVDSNPDKNLLLISVHANAASNGVWSNARGFGVFYDQKHIDVHATALHFATEIEKHSAEAVLHPKKLNARGDRGTVNTNGMYSIIYYPKCHSLLLELGFMDNKEEVEYLKSFEGREELARGIFHACLGVLQ